MIGNLPNSVYIVRSLLTELKQIKRANGYSMDVKTVKRPNYSPDDQDWKTALTEECPAILLWVTDEGDDTSGANVEEDRPVLGVQIVGIVQQDRDTQEAAQFLASDVRRVVRANPSRNYPDFAATNSWGVVSSPSGGRTFTFAYQKISESLSIGAFSSSWLITYRHPRSTG